MKKIKHKKTNKKADQQNRSRDMDAWNRLTDLRRERSGWKGGKRLSKEPICIVHGHRQWCDEGLGWGGGEQKKGEMKDICNSEQYY